MTTVDNANDAGKSAEDQEIVDTPPTDTPDGGDDGWEGGDDGWSTQDKENGKGKGVSKLLNQRNQARKEAEELRAKYEPDALQAVEDVISVKERKVERQSFQATYWEDALDEVEAILEQHPSLSYEDAYKVANPEWFAATGQKFNVQWTTPESLKRDKALGEMSPQELEQQAQKEFAGLV